MSTDRHILATSAGFRPTGRGPYSWQPGPLLERAIGLSGSRPARLCYLPTAGGDNPAAVAGFYAAFAGRSDVRTSHLQLFLMPNVDDPATHLLEQDVIWVGGGSVANMVALWRTHGLDATLRAAWEQGTVLCGVSAGSICWHVGGPTDSFGLRLRAFHDGLGLLPYGNGVHYDSEEQRRPLLHRLVATGELPTSYATDDGVGLHYIGTELAEAVTQDPTKSAYRVQRDGDRAVETRLTTRLLD